MRTLMLAAAAGALAFAVPQSAGAAQFSPSGLAPAVATGQGAALEQVAWRRVCTWRNHHRECRSVNNHRRDHHRWRWHRRHGVWIRIQL